MRDSVVPAENVFVEKCPKVSQAERTGGKKRSQHSPAAQPPGDGRAIEAGEFEFCQSKARSGPSVYEQ
jgi:hypothetical protein